MRWRSALFSFVFCLLLLGPAALSVSYMFGVEVPPWLSSQDAAEISARSVVFTASEHLSVDDFQCGELQQSVEDSLEWCIPLKAIALLGNAQNQRSAIEASNILFGFDAYPTYYGSGHVVAPAYQAVAAQPLGASKRYNRKAKKFAQGLKEFAAAYPDKEFCMVLGDQAQISDANPAVPLVSKRFSTQDAVRILADATELPNVHLVCVSYSDPSDYYKHYYQTDHHWNGLGTIECYDILREEMGLEYAFNSATKVTFADFSLEGTYAREGLMFMPNSVVEPTFDYDGLTSENMEETPAAVPDGQQLIWDNYKTTRYDFYMAWYGHYLQAQEAPIYNEETADAPRAMLSMDSYGCSLRWLLAKNFRSVHCWRDMQMGAEHGQRLEERMAVCDPDVIYFVGNIFALNRTLSNHPDYFKVGE